MPNSALLQGRIHNLSRQKERRVVITLNITYETPYEKLRKIPDLLKSITRAIPGLRFDRAFFRNMATSSLDFELVYFVEKPDFTPHLEAQEKLMFEIIRQFEAEGIAFAYPTQTLHVHGRELVLSSSS
jgi:small-conductance mechanosensitive channel